GRPRSGAVVRLGAPPRPRRRAGRDPGSPAGTGPGDSLRLPAPVSGPASGDLPLVVQQLAVAIGDVRPCPGGARYLLWYHFLRLAWRAGALLLWAAIFHRGRFAQGVGAGGPPRLTAVPVTRRRRTMTAPHL